MAVGRQADGLVLLGATGDLARKQLAARHEIAMAADIVSILE